MQISINKVSESKFVSDGPVRGPRGNRNYPSGIRSMFGLLPSPKFLSFVLKSVASIVKLMYSHGNSGGVKLQLAQREKKGNNFPDRASGGPASASHQKPKDIAASSVIK